MRGVRVLIICFFEKKEWFSQYKAKAPVVAVEPVVEAVETVVAKKKRK